MKKMFEGRIYPQTAGNAGRTGEEKNAGRTGEARESGKGGKIGKKEETVNMRETGERIPKPEQVLLSLPEEWDERTKENPWLDSGILDAALHSDTAFSLVMHPAYCCCEYQRALNVFTFGRLKWEIRFIVIAPPLSVDECGYTGDPAALIADYKRRKGLFLMLNLHPGTVLPPDIALGETLPAALFDNHYESFEDYLHSLRSPYRRRLLQAQRKAAGLRWAQIAGQDFDETLHRLYLDVLHRSRYPLETLEIGFFQSVQGRIEVLYNGAQPVAFVLVMPQNETLHFLFGGMDYAKRDEFDLYYNMLLRIVEIGIAERVRTVDFGQTAESSKGRIGCRLEPRGMAFFSGSRVISLLVRLFSKALSYKAPREVFRVFK